MLDLLDYNLLVSSYGQVTDETRGLADLNMNQKVDEEDINIFYSNLANRQGD